MKERYCAICLDYIESEDAPILAMSGAGVPRCLCDSCAKDLDTASLGRDYSEVTAAMDKIAANLSDKNIDDPCTVNTVTSILAKAAVRAKKIKDGEYDFALDDVDESMDELPEELLETEEDRELDAIEEEREKKIDKVINWIWVALIVAAVGFMIWWFFLK